MATLYGTGDPHSPYTTRRPPQGGPGTPEVKSWNQVPSGQRPKLQTPEAARAAATGAGTAAVSTPAGGLPDLGAVAEEKRRRRDL